MRFEPQKNTKGRSWLGEEFGAPLGTSLFSRPEERCGADCPYFGLTLWYLSVSSYCFCSNSFSFLVSFFFDTSNKPLSRSQTQRPDPFQVSAVEVWTSCILQHIPLLISDELYQQLHYSLHLVTSSAFMGTVEDLQHSVTLQQILFLY